MDVEKTMQFILDTQAKLEANAGLHDQQLLELKKLTFEIAEGTARLLRVAELHQQRLDSHNDRLDNLEGNS